MQGTALWDALDLLRQRHDAGEIESLEYSRARARLLERRSRAGDRRQAQRPFAGPDRRAGGRRDTDRVSA